MPRVCIVKNCKSLGTNEARLRGVTFHALPKDPKIRSMWLENVRKVNKDGSAWVPYKDATVCSKHFRKSCFTGPAMGVPNTPIEAIEVKNPSNQRGQGKKSFFKEDPRGVDCKSARKKNKRSPDEAAAAVEGIKTEQDLNDEDASRQLQQYVKPNQYRKRLMYSAVPTLEMGIPTSQLTHQVHVVREPIRKRKPLMVGPAFASREGKSLEGKSKFGTELKEENDEEEELNHFRMMKADKVVLEALGISRQTWSALSVSERRDRRSYYQSLSKSLSDHTYSSSIVQGAEKMAAEIKRLKLLTESLVHKLSVEKHKSRRIQSSLSKACSMLERCAKYEFVDEYGHKLARPKGKQRSATKVPDAHVSLATTTAVDDVTLESRAAVDDVIKAIGDGGATAATESLENVSCDVKEEQNIDAAAAQLNSSLIQAVQHHHEPHYGSSLVVTTAETATEQMPHPDFYEMATPSDEYFQQHSDNSAAATCAVGGGIIYQVLSADVAASSTSESAVAVTSSNQFAQLDTSSPSNAFLLESSAVATAAVNPDGTEKVEFVNILT